MKTSDMGFLIAYPDMMHRILAVVVQALCSVLRSGLVSFVITVRLSWPNSVC